MTLDARIARLVAAELDPGYRRRVATVMRWLPPSAEEGSHVVDIGCGRGYFVHYYAALGQRRVTGIERDDAIAARAADLNRAARGASILRADAAALPLADATCSGAILSEVLEHVEDDEAVVREAFRVLRPGGVAALTVPHARYPWAWDPVNRTLTSLRLAPVRRGPLAGIWAGHLRLYEIARLREIVRGAGFAIDAECAFVRHCLPFSHNLIYGLGKPLLESGWLPERLARAVDRGQHAAERPLPGGLAGAVRALLSVGERWNRDDEGFDGPSLNLGLKLRKP